jgi:hypothetical protein
MAEPCVADSIYIELDTAGTPAVLTATLRNPEETFSATQGDHTLHDVTDHNVVHTQTQTVTIDNSAGTAPARGVAIYAPDPIYVASGSIIEALWHNTLTIDSVLADEGNESAQAIVVASATGALWIPVKTLVGQIDIPAGDSISVTFAKSIENVGDSETWQFLMGGDKLVAQMGY